MVKALIYSLEGWGFKPQQCPSAALVPLSKALNNSFFQAEIFDLMLKKKKHTRCPQIFGHIVHFILLTTLE